jgi:YfiH family protein
MQIVQDSYEITCPTLAACSGVRHGFFTRKGGVSSGLYSSLNCGFGSGDDVEIVAENRARVAAALGQNSDALCTAYQIHSPRAVVLDHAWAWRDAPEADALVTRTPGIILGILTADCLPILFADSRGSVIGAAHAGWKGAISGVMEATIDAMVGLGARRQDIFATLGPAIAQESYEVGAEFRDRFISEGFENRDYFMDGERANHYMFDLKSYAENRLAKAGISQVNVLARDTCREEGDFFSYRRACLRAEPVYGRQVSAIVLEA